MRLFLQNNVPDNRGWHIIETWAPGEVIRLRQPATMPPERPWYESVCGLIMQAGSLRTEVSDIDHICKACTDIAAMRERHAAELEAIREQYGLRYIGPSRG